MSFTGIIRIPHIRKYSRNGKGHITACCFRLIMAILSVFPIEVRFITNMHSIFQASIRSRKHKSGLDYSKIVIINTTRYIESVDTIIDKDEFNETMMNLDRIKSEALKFVEDYVFHMNGIEFLHKREFERRYSFCPLQYFHKELGVVIKEK